MKRIKVLGSVLKRTRADKIIIGFIVFIFAIAAVIQLVEPDINRYCLVQHRFLLFTK